MWTIPFQRFGYKMMTNYKLCVVVILFVMECAELNLFLKVLSALYAWHISKNLMSWHVVLITGHAIPTLMALFVLLLFLSLSVVTLQGQLCSFYLIIPHVICLFRTIGCVVVNIYIFNFKVLIVRLGVMWRIDVQVEILQPHLLNAVIIRYQILQEAVVTEIATIVMSFLINLEDSADHVYVSVISSV